MELDPGMRAHTHAHHQRHSQMQVGERKDLSHRKLTKFLCSCKFHFPWFARMKLNVGDGAALNATLDLLLTSVYLLSRYLPL